MENKGLAQNKNFAGPLARHSDVLFLAGHHPASGGHVYDVAGHDRRFRIVPPEMVLALSFFGGLYFVQFQHKHFDKNHKFAFPLIESD
jgi:hypothetical protein